MKIIIDSKIPFIKGALEKVGEVIYLAGNKIGPDDVKDADALIIRTRTICNRQLLEGSSVKIIATATIGYDHIDTAYCDNAGIRWTNAPGCNSSSVEQYIVSSLLYLANMEGFELTGTTVGIIGVGNVGSKVGRALKALGCKVILNDPPRALAEGSDDFSDLDELLEKAHIVTMHVPLAKDGPYKTEGLADSSFFGKMKEGALFINTSRGEVVSEPALKAAMREDKLSGAVLDVFQGEPRVNRELLSMLTIATPHIAGYSSDGKANGTTMSVRAVSSFLRLGMDDWEPDNLPVPGDTEIFVDGDGPEVLDLVTEVYARTYSVQEDHDRFMDNMEQFEALRGGYRIRREPSAYRVRIFNDDGQYRKIFEGLGFSVIGDSCF
ncbi:MAG: 4-phosphoerythronate dehydrogenase [Bacteroidales bacterium]